MTPAIQLWRLRLYGLCAVVAASLMFTASAQDRTAQRGTVIAECQDGSGKITYRIVCPPGSVQLNERVYSGDSSEASNAGNEDLLPVTLYSIPDCDQCDLVRNLLTRNNVSFSEKDVSGSMEVRDELLALTNSAGPQVTVPVMAVGEQAITGYNRSAIESTLRQSGHISEQPPTE